MSTPQKYVLPSEDRHIEFTGTQLAHVSSRSGSEDDAIRWTEVTIYRTVGKQYVLHRVGMSRVYHDAANPGKVTNGTFMSNADVCNPTILSTEMYNDLVPDPVSLAQQIRTSPEVYPDDFPAGILLESPRHKAFVAVTAAGLVEAAHDEDRDRVRYMTKLTERALRLASEQDANVAAAFLVERVA